MTDTQKPKQAAPAAVAGSVMARNRTKDDILHFLTKEQMVEEIIRLDAALAAAPTAQAAPVAQGDAEQRAMDTRHAAIYRWIIQHTDEAAGIIDAWREDGEADTDELHDALAARAAKEGGAA